MALNMSASAPQVNGKMSPSHAAEDEEMYTELLRMRDAVIAGTHPQFRLPPAVIEHLKASLVVPNAAAHMREPTKLTHIADSARMKSGIATNHSQPSYAAASMPSSASLPGLQASSAPSTNGTHQSPGLRSVSYTGLDPIFLEKSDSLVRAEGQLKRQRIERELQQQVEHRKYSVRDRDLGVDSPSAIDVEAILRLSASREKHVSGLRLLSKPDSPASSSFDENDYYSSQVQSDWSSDASPNKRSDHAAGAFTADFEQVDEPGTTSTGPVQGKLIAATTRAPLAQRPDNRAIAPTHELDDEYDPEDMDDEYTPPDVSTFENTNGSTHGVHVLPATPEDEDDNSEYEPGELTPGTVLTNMYGQQQPQNSQGSPQVPVIRNHLTHIAAPQPSRVSPLAVAKGPSIELELVNGRPEIVQKPYQAPIGQASRASTASPSGNGTGPNSRKASKRSKKRKRREEAEVQAQQQQQQQQQRAKKRRERLSRARTPPSAANAEPYIKDEPVSPPPLELHDVPRPYPNGYPHHSVPTIDLVSPRQPSQAQYLGEAPRHQSRYEVAHMGSPNVQVVASPGAYRPAYRDTQDLRRVASLQHAQRLRSPAPHDYSRDRVVSMGNYEARTPQSVYPVGGAEPPRYQQHRAENVRYVRVERSPSPPKLQEYHNVYSPQPQSPTMMPPSSAPTRRIVIDQYGNRYYAAEPVAVPLPRASVAPVERRAPPDMGYERAPSRMSIAYAPPYDPTESRMAPPPPPPIRRRISDDAPVHYVDSNGYRVRDYGGHLPESGRYVEQPPSPVYHPAPRYETMPPPPAPMPPTAREQTSPVYAPPGYSIRPEDPAPIAPPYVPRQVSVAHYFRHDMPPPPPPPRAISVIPRGYESGAAPSHSGGNYSMYPSDRYVDHHGQEIYPRDVRQASEFRYE